MALPSRGTITMGQIRTELKQTGAIRLGSSECRKLAGVPSGTIKMSNFYGKSNAYYIKFVPWVYDRRAVTPGGTVTIGTMYTSKAVTTSNTEVLKYSGKVLSNLNDIYIQIGEGKSGDHHYSAVDIGKNPIGNIHKKFTVTRKVNGGSAKTTTYTVTSDNRINVAEGTALCFRGIANGAVVELTISGT